MASNSSVLSCGCSADTSRCGHCRFTQFATEHSELGELRNRQTRRAAWEKNRKLSADRAHFPVGQFHYVDEYLETLLPSDFDEHYKCDNCKLNHLEEDCPRPVGYRNPHAPIIKGKQRMGHIDTKKEAIDNAKSHVMDINNAIAAEDEKLRSGHKFCHCCCHLISPDNFGETVVIHPGKVVDIGEPHESMRYAVFAHGCCEKKEGSEGCCIHTHFFE